MIELKKIDIAGLEGKTLDVANQINAQVEAIQALEAKSVSAEALSALEVKLAELEKLEVKSYDREVLELKNAMKDLENSLLKKQRVVEVSRSLEQEIVSAVEGLGVKTVSELKSFLAKNGTQTLEIKAISPIASTANTDTVGRTNLNNTVAWTPTIQNAFIPFMRVVAEASGKSKFGYVEGSYTGAAAYVGEGAGNGNSDSASAAATFEDYAKVQSVLSVNTEVYEDIPDFAAGLVSQMQISISKFVDDEALSGDGLAPAGVKHIKGINAYATEFDTTGFETTVFMPNTADVVDALATKISMEDGGYSANMAFMHPLELFKLRREKDNDGQPIVLKDAFGNETISGVVVKATKKVAVDVLYVLDMNVVELRTKRAMQLKMGQILANDAINDKQSAILMARYQILVRNLDKVAVLKCSSIAATKAIIAKAQIAN